MCIFIKKNQCSMMNENHVTVGNLLADFDELMRLITLKINNEDCLQAFMSYVEVHERCISELKNKEKDFQEIVKNKEKDFQEIIKNKEKQLKSLTKERDNLETKLKLSRRFIDEEKMQRKRAEEDIITMEQQMQLIRNLLQDNRNKLHDETKEKLQYLSTIDQRLSTINESMYHDTTGSFLSDLSYSRSEDDLDIDSIRLTRKIRKSRAAISDGHHTSPKRRRSALNTARSEILTAGPGECLVATTRVDLDGGGVPTASSVIETYPSSTSIIPPLKPVTPSAPQMSTDSGESENDENQKFNSEHGKNNVGLQSPGSNLFPFNMNMVNTRTHSLISKTIIKPEACYPCGKKIKFGKIAYKCTDCKSLCHVECKDKLRTPCIPLGSGTPTSKDNFGFIADYAPPNSPMVPAIIVHCITEIEERGFNEVGLYRVSGSDKEVKALRERFLRGRAVPNLSNISDINVITGCLKDFLRSLREPLTTFSQRPKFVEAMQIGDLETRRAALYQAFTELPQPNRDTLAYLILHLQRISEVKECRMSLSSLSKIMGPTVIGYSRADPEMIKMHMFEETEEDVQVMEELLSIPSEYWKNFLVRSTPAKPCTPSTSSLRDQCGFLDSPMCSGWYTVRKKKTC
ncbi:rac GTPase-activating protein 1-like [Lycorma delicatula]|uniref:rac GTPase-activating protein 1-like n=1 Tax=Lycorma delicatula TaxID=130591 RepID=UPI003F50E037